MKGTKFTVDKRYKLIDKSILFFLIKYFVVGNGAYGAVAAGIDLFEKNEQTNTYNKIAIKKIERAFDHLVYSKRTLRELKLLRLLDNENVINL